MLHLEVIADGGVGCHKPELSEDTEIEAQLDVERMVPSHCRAGPAF